MSGFRTVRSRKLVAPGDRPVNAQTYGFDRSPNVRAVNFHQNFVSCAKKIGASSLTLIAPNFDVAYVWQCCIFCPVEAMAVPSLNLEFYLYMRLEGNKVAQWSQLNQVEPRLCQNFSVSGWITGFRERPFWHT
jgi:hypothetical protein